MLASCQTCSLCVEKMQQVYHSSVKSPYLNDMTSNLSTYSVFDFLDSVVFLIPRFANHKYSLISTFSTVTSSQVLLAMV